MNGNVRGGLIFSGRYIFTIILSFTSIVLMVYILSIITFGKEIVTLLSLVLTVLPAMVPFFLITVIAFLAGYCPEGTRDRLYIRFMMDLFKIFCIFYVSHSVEHLISVIEVDSSYGTYLRDTAIQLDVTIVAIILTALPLLSMVDNVLEYRQNKGLLSDTD